MTGVGVGEAHPRAAVLDRSFRAMASPVTLRVVEPGPDAPAALDRAEAVIRDVERTCSRFDPASALSEVNARPGEWHEVPATLALAVVEADRAHRATGGLFDPRIVDTLLAWGYDQTLPSADGPLAVGRLAAVGGGRGTVVHASYPPARWTPEVHQDGSSWLLYLDGEPIDLGGIGKGLAVRWAAAHLAGTGAGWLVDAGGDGAVGGVAHVEDRGAPWRVGVEDPAGGDEPVLVVETTDTAYATSSVRRRRWRADGAVVHHLVDPRTRRPGGRGLAAVTVVGGDPAWAEVWSKTLFLAGAATVRACADALGLAAAWVGLDGSVGTTAPMDHLTLWRR